MLFKNLNEAERTLAYQWYSAGQESRTKFDTTGRPDNYCNPEPLSRQQEIADWSYNRGFYHLPLDADLKIVGCYDAIHHIYEIYIDDKEPSIIVDIELQEGSLLLPGRIHGRVNAMRYIAAPKMTTGESRQFAHAMLEASFIAEHGICLIGE